MWKRFKNKQVDGNWLNTNFPCMMACPAHTNAGRYVELIAEGRFEDAEQAAFDLPEHRLARFGQIQRIGMAGT